MEEINTYEVLLPPFSLRKNLTLISSLPITTNLQEIRTKKEQENSTMGIQFPNPEFGKSM